MLAPTKCCKLHEHALANRITQLVLACKQSSSVASLTCMCWASSETMTSISPRSASFLKSGRLRTHTLIRSSCMPESSSRAALATAGCALLALFARDTEGADETEFFFAGSALSGCCDGYVRVNAGMECHVTHWAYTRSSACIKSFLSQQDQAGRAQQRAQTCAGALLPSNSRFKTCSSEKSLRRSSCVMTL
jgi:hypothetical protein